MESVRKLVTTDVIVNIGNMMRRTDMLFWSSASEASSNFSVWKPSALYALTTLTPVMLSRVSRLTASFRTCILLKYFIDRQMTSSITDVRMTTATAVATVHSHALPDILSMAQTAIIGDLTVT